MQKLDTQEFPTGGVQRLPEDFPHANLWSTTSGLPLENWEPGKLSILEKLTRAKFSQTTLGLDSHYVLDILRSLSEIRLEVVVNSAGALTHCDKTRKTNTQVRGANSRYLVSIN